MQRRISRFSTWIAGVAYFLAGLFPFNNADGYGHLALGRQIAELGEVPRVDLFSFWKPTPQPWHNFAWAYDLFSWTLYDAGGANALILLKCAALALLAIVLVQLAVRLSGHETSAAPITLTLLLLALPVARFRFTVRPQILGLLLPALILLGLFIIFSEKTPRRRRYLIVLALAALHIVWVNTHGSHLLGPVLTGIFAAFAYRTPAFRPAALLVALQILAMGCTPFGYGMIGDALSLIGRPEYRGLLLEWEPWTPKVPLVLLALPALYAVLILWALRPLYRQGRYGMAYAVFCVVLTLMAFRSLRFITHQLLLVSPFIAAGLAVRLRRSTLHPSLWWVPIAAATWAVSMSAHLLPPLGFGLGEAKTDYPWVAGEVIAEHVEEPRILANIRDGWMLLFAVPQGKFLIDGRVHFYGPEFAREIESAFGDVARFSALLDAYDVNTVVVDHTLPGHFPATEYLIDSADWSLVQIEDRHSAFVSTAQLSDLRPLRLIGAGFRTARTLDADLSVDELRDERARLGDYPSTVAIRAWVRGLELLRPLARDGTRAGFRMARTAPEQESARDAYRAFSEAAAVVPEFNAIELFRAASALTACDLELAGIAARKAERGGPNRATSLLAIEVALRGPDGPARASAQRSLQALRQRTESRDDPWVRAIVADVENRVRCP